MICASDWIIGLLLGVSAFVFVLSIIGYRRSGVQAMRLMAEGLAMHIAFTVLVLIVVYWTDWLERVNCIIVISADAAVFACAIVIGIIGGRFGARSS